jgi:hypothetical protein
MPFAHIVYLDPRRTASDRGQPKPSARQHK